MKKMLILMLCLVGFASSAQTAKELIGKWKLVKQTKDGVVTTPKDTYQIFMENGVFKGGSGGSERKGKWKLSEDNKELSVKISIINVKFTIGYFDAQKRTISSPQTGTLEYEKVAD